MRLRVTANTVAVALIALGCGSTADDDDAAHGGASAGGSSGATAGGSSGATAGGSSVGGASSGGAPGGAGKSTMSGAGTTGSAGGSSVSGSGGSAAGATGGAAGKSAMDSGAGGMPAAGAGGTGGNGGSSVSGAGGVGAAGQNGGTAGTFSGCGGDGPCTGGTAGRTQGGAGGRGAAGTSSAGKPGASGGAGGGACPASGHVSYTLAKNANPTADEQTAYGLITTAMDKAIQYYNCYTNITKAESVTYVPTVETADGNSNGSIRFGGKDYMEYITAMHEIAHTVGVGTYSQWGPLIVNGIFTGEHATTQLRAISGIADDQVHGDTQHFWPYGLNYTSEVKSEADVIDHCMMVVAIRLDMGFDP